MIEEEHLTVDMANLEDTCAQREFIFGSKIKSNSKLNINSNPALTTTMSQNKCKFYSIHYDKAELELVDNFVRSNELVGSSLEIQGFIEELLTKIEEVE